MPIEWVMAAGVLIGAMVVMTIALTFVPAMIYKRQAKADLATLCRGKLALTYDDGPGPKLTPELLRLLEKHGVKATFFLLGFRAARFPEISSLLAGSGHELGCHTHWHRKPWQTWPWLTWRDVHQGYETMRPWMADDAPFRPPFGKLTTWSWIAARGRKASICFWTADSRDSQPVLPEPSQTARAILDSAGAVVLLHSHDRGAAQHEYVLEITEQLILGAKQRGWKICTMKEILSGASDGA